MIPNKKSFDNLSIQKEKIFVKQYATEIPPAQITRLSFLPRGVKAFVALLLERHGSEVLTPEASDHCDIRNIPDLVAKSRERLALLGLAIQMEEVVRPNKFGVCRKIGSWRLVIADPGLWFGLDAVNDEG